MNSRVLDALENARASAGVFSCALALLLNGCAIILPQTSALRDAWPETLPAKVELTEVPFYPQVEFQCGPAALATVMTFSGVKIAPDDLVPQVYIPERKGTLQVEMLAAPRRYKLVSYPLAPRLEDVLREVASGNPVVVLHGYGVWPLKYWHYTVVVGYDRDEGYAILRSGMRERQTMPFAVLEYTWKDSERWAMVTSRPERVPVTAEEERYLEAVNSMARAADTATSTSAYRAFLKKWPGNLTASVGLANALHVSKELPEAESVLRTALAAHPDSVVLLNNLAQTVSDEGRHKEALELIDRAVALGGDFTQAAQETRQTILARMRR